MWTVVRSSLLGHFGRAVGLLAGIAVAVACFAVLTATTETSRLRVVGTVESNSRSAYDVLVRPSGSRLMRETSAELVRPNFLSDHFGGITLEQVERIRSVPHVEVAAPVAMVGYSLVTTAVPIDLGGIVPKDRRSVYRLRGTRVVDGGLTRMEIPEYYVYFTPNPISLDTNQGVFLEEGDDEAVAVCGGDATPVPRYPYGPLFDLSCQSLTANIGGSPGNPGQAWIDWPVPFLIAAVDPAQEAALVGLDRAVVSGGYLPRVYNGSTNDRVRQVPVLYANAPTSDATYEMQVAALPDRVADRVPGASVERLVAGPFSAAAEATEVVWSGVVSAADAHRSLSVRLSGEGYRPETAYWTPGPVQYAALPGGALAPQPVSVPASVWEQEAFGIAPPEAADTQFRQVTRYGGSSVTFSDEYRVQLSAVGTFDPSALRGYSDLSAVPLTTYLSPRLSCADQRSCDLLGGQELLPNGSPGGYLQQPPLMLTTLDALPAFYNGYYREDGAGTAPVSAVRVRVAGVTGVDAVSRERVRVVAEQIAAQTGLDVDVTMGSSPTRQAIELPAGAYGRPALSLRELWTKKGVAAVIITAVDRKSLVLFLLILVVCTLFVANAAASAVRSRREELGVLAFLGWTVRGRFGLILGELLVVGLSAGLLGSTAAWVAGSAIGVDLSWPQALLAVPAAVALSALAGLAPAWRACRIEPMAALRPAVSVGRRTRLRLGVPGLAVANLRRRPGRAALGGATLALAVAASTILMAVVERFQGVLVGNLLGEAIAVRIRGVDLAAVIAMLGLATVAVADVVYLNVRERTAEIALLRATGWTESAMTRLVAVEGLVLGALGATLGAAVGLAAAAGFAGSISVVAGLLPTAATTAGLGTALACMALIAPVTALRRQFVARQLAKE